jgi:hypothetical protein
MDAARLGAPLPAAPRPVIPRAGEGKPPPAT